MTGRWRRFVPLAVFAVLAGVLYLALGRDPETLPSPLVDRPVPVFALPDLQQPDRTRTPADLPAAPFLLNVWATWCISCRVEHPYLNGLRKDGVPIVGLNYKDARPEALRWLAERGNPYRFSLFDADGRLGLDLGVYGAPETYLIDGDGVIRFKHVGVVNDRVWRDELKPRYDALREATP